MAIVAWLEWTLASLFARAAVKLIADADDWRPASAVVLRMYAVSGLLGFVALWLAAGPLALAHARAVACSASPRDRARRPAVHADAGASTGARRHRRVRATRDRCRVAMDGPHGAGAHPRWSGGCRSTARLLGVVGASVLELLAARRFVQPSLRGGDHGPGAKQCGRSRCRSFAAAISLRLFDKLDLFVLKALGGTATLAGLYGAAQNLTIIPNLVALSVTTLLLSTLSRALRTGDADGARSLAANAIRGVLVLFPFAGVAAGAATGHLDADLRRPRSPRRVRCSRCSSSPLS